MTNTNHISKPHIVLFPFLAQGHIRPFLSLFSCVHRQHPDHTITLVSTPRNIATVRSTLPSSSSLNFHSIAFFPESYSLPSNAESTADIPYALLTTFFEASESLCPAFENFISTLTGPVYIISDMFFAWSVEVSRKFNTFHSVFLSSGAYGTTVWSSLRLSVPLGLMPQVADEFQLPEFPDVKIHISQCGKNLLEADGNCQLSTYIQRQLKFVFQSDATLVNTVEGFEVIGLQMLRKQLPTPVFSIGPLLHSAPLSSEKSGITEWLNTKPAASVLYISFGSQHTIHARPMIELASALEHMNRPFIWVIRPPIGFETEEKFKPEWLPEGFEGKMKLGRKGLLIHEWAPQVEILAHAATGAFLSHCGWNSTLESSTYGVPIIAWPLSADQFYNSKMLEELGLGMELARGVVTDLKRDWVQEVVETVMGENEKAKEMKMKAREIKEVMDKAWNEEGEDGTSRKGLNDFFEFAAKKLAGDKQFSFERKGSFEKKKISFEEFTGKA
ncbi:UDP-glycosyltransferase 92A1-like protein [Carex littledalei]|uniref:UDP-glycosyltransferase 92A1-like protein n=1 Tax=Carex littledalei TaxID=544730 RepID=A0A833RHA8_9POAL|nr:UDP-glycosyltransferase 92A1-like protein [Carex littledalei]